MSKFTGNIIRLPAVTPTQNSASGVYTLDDQFTAQSSGTWPIVRDQYFNYTTLLLTGAVQGTAYPNPVTQPYSFLSDASTNNFVVSPNGDVSARPFNPYLNNYSAFFDGTNDYCSLAGSADFSIPTSTTPFTVEAWIYPASASALSVIWTERYNGSGNTVSLACGLMDGSSFWTPGRYLGFAYYNGSGWTGTASNAQVELNTWSHVAYVFTGSACKIFLNGLDVTKAGGPTTWAITGVSGEAWYIGAVWDAGIYFNGYISNLRYVVGTAVYTSNFTPSTTPLQNITNTKLLACQSNRFIDNSSSPKTITPLNGVAVSQNSPFVSYDTTNGSGYFDGNDWLSAPDSSAYTMGTGDFTVEAWVYCTATDFASSRYIIAQRNASADTSISFAINLIGGGARKVRLLCFDSGGASYEALCASDVINLNEWTHIAGVRNGATLRIYVNGVQQGTANISTASLVDSDGGVAIGRLGDANFYYWLGYINNVRVTKGGCLYPSGTQFTPPAAPLTTTVSAGTVSLLTLQTRAPATNNGFIDSSPNNFVVTRNGNTTQGSFSPFSPTGWGNRFDGTSGQLAFPTGSFVFGNSDFTIEAWVYNTGTTTGAFFTNQYTSGATTTSIIGAIGSLNGNFDMYIGSSVYSLTGINPTANQWVHLAIVRTGGTVSVFQNGNRTHTRSDLSTLSINAGGTAVPPQMGNGVNGYMSNHRIIIGSGPYDATQTSITVPTVPLTAITNTKLLTCQANRFRDASPNNLTITVTGSPSVQAFSPFAPAQSYIPSQIGGSGYFDGTSDWLSGVGTTSSFNFLHNTTALFTIEAWVYITSTGSQKTIICTNNDASSAAVGCWFLVETNNTLRLFITKGSTGNFVINASSSASVQTNAWSHIAVTYNQSLGSNNATFYINGGLAGNATKLGNAPVDSNATTAMNVGSYNGGGAFMNGYIFNLRISNSIVYNSSFTPPTAPLTAIPNTSLLLNFTNGGIVDATGKNNLETVANSGVQTSQAKWSPGSMYFDGNGDYLKSNVSTSDLYGFGGDFTIELWLYRNATGLTVLVDSRPTGGGGTSAYYVLYINASNFLSWFVGGSARITGTTAISNSTWYHIAVARSGNSTKMYLNGAQEGSPYTDSTALICASGRPYVGADANDLTNNLNGYIDDLRITKGYARYATGTGGNAGQMVFNGTNTLALPTGPFPLG